MTPDQYVESILAKYTALTGMFAPAPLAANLLLPVLQQWAGTQLASIQYSGSYAKGTAVKGGSDIDLFISLQAKLRALLFESISVRSLV